MNLDDFQKACERTAMYPKERALEYVTLGLASEAGELAGKVKKLIRDSPIYPEITQDQREALMLEIGDNLWYISMLAKELGYSLEEVAVRNTEKLMDRKHRGVIGGSGDKR